MKHTSKVFLAASSAALAVLVLAAAGFSLAHWSDQVSLQGSASTGVLQWDVLPTLASWNTNHTMRFSVGVRDEGQGTGVGSVDVALDNAYPLAYGTLVLKVENKGTIPVHVTFWVEAAPSGSCDNDDLLDYILLNPSLDLPHYTGQFNYNGYSVSIVASGWNDSYTKPVTWWTANHGSPATAVSLEDIMAGGHVLKLPNNTTTVMQYDSDNIIEPGESSVIFVWIGISDAIEGHEELMGTSCSPAFTIHYIATQAVPNP